MYSFLCIYCLKDTWISNTRLLEDKIRLELLPELAVWESSLLNALKLVRGLLGLDKKVPLLPDLPGCISCDKSKDVFLYR